jgi:hypothetical protein
VGIFSKFGKVSRVAGTYKDTVSSAEYLARTSFGMLAEKPADEQRKILERVTELLGRLHEAIDREVPLVVTLTMLTAIQGLDKTTRKATGDIAHAL